MFLIVFLWQFPHFLAIAWIYRDDYQRAGFRMLTVGDARRQDDGLPGRLLRAGACSRGALARDRSAWPARSILPAPCSWASCIWSRPLDSGSRPAIAVHAGCCVRRSSICPRSCFCSCLTPCRIDEPHRRRIVSLLSCFEGRYHDGSRHPQLDRDRARRAWLGPGPHSRSPSPRSLPARSPCGCSWPRK